MVLSWLGDITRERVSQARVIMVGSERWLDLGSIWKVDATEFPSGWDRSRGKDSKNDHKV